jgi:hypothetical protein
MHKIKIVLLIVGGIIGLVLLGKVIWIILNTTIALWDSAVAVLNFIVNLLTFVAVIVGPLFVVYLIALLIDAAFKKLAGLLSSIQAHIQSSGSQLLPLSITGVTQALLLALSKDFTPSDTKVVMSIFLWVGTTLLLMTTSTEGKSRWIGIWGAALSVIFSICFLLFRYEITSIARGRDIITMMISRSRELSATDLLALALIVALLVLLVVITVLQMRSIMKTTNRSFQSTPSGGRG